MQEERPYSRGDGDHIPGENATTGSRAEGRGSPSVLDCSQLSSDLYMENLGLKNENDDLKERLSHLKIELQDEISNEKFLRREQLVETKLLRDEERKKTQSLVTETRRKLYKEKQQEMAELRDRLNSDKDKEIAHILKQKEDETKKLQQQWLKEKDEAIQKVRLQCTNEIREETQKSFEKQLRKLENSVEDLKIQKRQVEENCKLVQEADKRKAQEIRRIHSENENELTRLKRNSWKEGRKQMAEIRQLTNIIYQLERKLGVESGHYIRLQIEKDGLRDKLDRVRDRDTSGRKSPLLSSSDLTSDLSMFSFSAVDDSNPLCVQVKQQKNTISQLKKNLQDKDRRIELLKQKVFKTKGRFSEGGVLHRSLGYVDDVLSHNTSVDHKDGCTSPQFGHSTTSSETSSLNDDSLQSDDNHEVEIIRKLQKEMLSLQKAHSLLQVEAESIVDVKRGQMEKQQLQSDLIEAHRTIDELNKELSEVHDQNELLEFQQAERLQEKENYKDSGVDSLDTPTLCVHYEFSDDELNCSVEEVKVKLEEFENEKKSVLERDEQLLILQAKTLLSKISQEQYEKMCSLNEKRLLSNIEDGLLQSVIPGCIASCELGIQCDIHSDNAIINGTPKVDFAVQCDISRIEDPEFVKFLDLDGSYYRRVKESHISSETVASSNESIMEDESRLFQGDVSDDVFELPNISQNDTTNNVIQCSIEHGPGSALQDIAENDIMVAAESAEDDLQSSVESEIFTGDVSDDVFDATGNHDDRAGKVEVAVQCSIMEMNGTDSVTIVDENFRIFLFRKIANVSEDVSLSHTDFTEFDDSLEEKLQEDGVHCDAKDIVVDNGPIRNDIRHSDKWLSKNSDLFPESDVYKSVSRVDQNIQCSLLDVKGSDHVEIFQEFNNLCFKRIPQTCNVDTQTDLPGTSSDAVLHGPSETTDIREKHDREASEKSMLDSAWKDVINENEVAKGGVPIDCLVYEKEEVLIVICESCPTKYKGVLIHDWEDELSESVHFGEITSELCAGSSLRTPGRTLSQNGPASNTDTIPVFIGKNSSPLLASENKFELDALQKDGKVETGSDEIRGISCVKVTAPHRTETNSEVLSPVDNGTFDGSCRHCGHGKVVTVDRGVQCEFMDLLSTSGTAIDFTGISDHETDTSLIQEVMELAKECSQNDALIDQHLLEVVKSKGYYEDNEDGHVLLTSNVAVQCAIDDNTCTMCDQQVQCMVENTVNQATQCGIENVGVGVQCTIPSCDKQLQWSVEDVVDEIFLDAGTQCSKENADTAVQCTICPELCDQEVQWLSEDSIGEKPNHQATQCQPENADAYVQSTKAPQSCDQEVQWLSEDTIDEKPNNQATQCQPENADAYVQSTKPPQSCDQEIQWLAGDTVDEQPIHQEIQCSISQCDQEVQWLPEDIQLEQFVDQDVQCTIVQRDESTQSEKLERVTCDQVTQCQNAIARDEKTQCTIIKSPLNTTNQSTQVCHTRSCVDICVSCDILRTVSTCDQITQCDSVYTKNLKDSFLWSPPDESTRDSSVYSEISHGLEDSDVSQIYLDSDDSIRFNEIVIDSRIVCEQDAGSQENYRGPIRGNLDKAIQCDLLNDHHDEVFHEEMTIFQGKYQTHCTNENEDHVRLLKSSRCASCSSQIEMSEKTMFELTSLKVENQNLQQQVIELKIQAKRGQEEDTENTSQPLSTTTTSFPKVLKYSATVKPTRRNIARDFDQNNIIYDNEEALIASDIIQLSSLPAELSAQIENAFKDMENEPYTPPLRSPSPQWEPETEVTQVELGHGEVHNETRLRADEPMIVRSCKDSSVPGLVETFRKLDEGVFDGNAVDPDILPASDKRQHDVGLDESSEVDEDVVDSEQESRDSDDTVNMTDDKEHSDEELGRMPMDNVALPSEGLGRVDNAEHLHEGVDQIVIDNIEHGDDERLDHMTHKVTNDDPITTRETGNDSPPNYPPPSFDIPPPIPNSLPPPLFSHSSGVIDNELADDIDALLAEEYAGVVSPGARPILERQVQELLENEHSPTASEPDTVLSMDSLCVNDIVNSDKLERLVSNTSSVFQGKYDVSTDLMTSFDHDDLITPDFDGNSLERQESRVAVHMDGRSRDEKHVAFDQVEFSSTASSAVSSQRRKHTPPPVAPKPKHRSVSLNIPLSELPRVPIHRPKSTPAPCPNSMAAKRDMVDGYFPPPGLVTQRASEFNNGELDLLKERIVFLERQLKNKEHLLQTMRVEATEIETNAFIQKKENDLKIMEENVGFLKRENQNKEKELVIKAGELNKANYELEQCKSDYSNSEKEREELEQKVVLLENQLNNLHSLELEMKELKCRNSLLQDENNNLKDRINRLHKADEEFVELEKIISSLQAKLKELEDMKRERDDFCEQLRAIKNQKDDLVQKGRKVETERNDFLMNNKLMEQQKENLEARNKSLQRTNDTFKTKISNLESEFRDCQKQCFEAQRERDDSCSQLRKREVERDELRKRVNELLECKSELKQSQSKSRDFERELSYLTAQCKKLEGERTELSSELNNSLKERSKLEGRNAELEQMSRGNEKMEEKFHTLKLKIAELTSQRDDAEVQLPTLKAKVALLKKACKEKDEQLEKLKEESRDLKHSIATSALDDLSKIKSYGFSSPENFVKFGKDSNNNDKTSRQNQEKGQKYVVLFDYDPARLSTTGHPEKELQLCEGDVITIYGEMDLNGYYVAELDGKKGLVSSLYIEELDDFDIRRMAKPHKTPSPKKLFTETSPLKRSSAPELIKRPFVAIEDYNPYTSNTSSRPDLEVPLTAGEVITVVGDVDANGYYTVEKRGKLGLIPSNLVKPGSPSNLRSTNVTSFQNIPNGVSSAAVSNPSPSNRTVLLNGSAAFGNNPLLNQNSNKNSPGPSIIPRQTTGEVTYQTSTTHERIESYNNEGNLLNQSNAPLMMEPRMNGVISGLPSPPRNFRVLRCVNKDALLVGWLLPDIDDMGRNNGLPIKGYKIRVNADVKMETESAYMAKALVEKLDLSRPVELTIETVAENGFCSEKTITHFNEAIMRETTSVALEDVSSSENDTSYKTYVALYSYDPVQNSPNPDPSFELQFQEGDIVRVYDTSRPDGFYSGQVGGEKGLVPSNFIEEIAVSRRRPTNLEKSLELGRQRSSSPRKVKAMVAIADYDPVSQSRNHHSEKELGFTGGQIIRVHEPMRSDGFYETEVNGIKRLVPSNFLKPCKRKSPKSTTASSNAYTSLPRRVQFVNHEVDRRVPNDYV